MAEFEKGIPKLKPLHEHIEGVNRIRNLLYAAGMAEISFRENPNKRSGEMAEHNNGKRKECIAELTRIEKEFGVSVIVFKSEQACKEAVDDIALARRFKNGLMAMPSLNRLRI